MAHIAMVEGRAANPLVEAERAVALGHRVTLLTQSLEDMILVCAPVDSPTRHRVELLADVVTTDTADPTALARALDGLGPSLDGVFTTRNARVSSVAQAARQVGLRGLDPAVAATLGDKLRVRQALAAASVAQPRFAPGGARLAQEDGGIAAAVGFPAVVKPVDGSASRGVTRIDGQDELPAALDAIGEHRESSQPLSGDWLVEEFVAGDIVGCEVATLDGRHFVYGITGKVYVNEGGERVEVGGVFPLQATQAVASQIVATTISALDALGIDNAVTQTELVLGARGPMIIEVNGRVANGPVPELVEAATGRHPFDDVIRVCLGMEIPPLSGARAQTACARVVLADRAGMPANSHRIVEPVLAGVDARWLEDGREVGAAGSVRRPRHLAGFVLTRGQHAASVLEQADRAVVAATETLHRDEQPS